MIIYLLIPPPFKPCSHGPSHKNEPDNQQDRVKQVDVDVLGGVCSDKLVHSGTLSQEVVSLKAINNDIVSS